METEVRNNSERVYAVVNNIPSVYRSADLRRFFSQLVETEGFDCFHFRHRPEKQSVKTSISSSSEKLPEASSSKSNHDSDSETFCCILRVTEVKFIQLLRTYHQRNWRDSKGGSLPSKCLISRLRTYLSNPSECRDSTTDKNTVTRTGASATKYQTRGEKRQLPPDREEFKEEDLIKLPEMRPPTVMPHGNVGTPTMHFLKLINECKLPPSIIKKLQLDFPKSKNKGKYGNVPFDYQTNFIETIESDDGDGDERARETSALDVSDNEATVSNHSTEVNSQHISQTSAPQSSDQNKESEPDYKEKRRLKKLAKRETRRLMAKKIEEKMIEFEKAASDSGEDNDTCEEWERHEGMYDDVTNQGRTKDRLFEEEMEVVWEKGGSGLVFYTDAQYWQEQEGDFDEQTTDDLNVDMSAYYEDGAGDKDIRDFLTIRTEQRRRRGIDQTDRFTAGIGKFERHTKGFGRKIMEKQGWTEGSGLGSSAEGIADALDNEGKRPRDKQGLGYRGEKLVPVRYGRPKQKKRRAEGDVLISTIYDDPAETDPLELPKRRNEPSYTKHRNRIN
ncbi:G patch domain-containing protein 3-like [Littorina saxatilis]|uniref:G-patch domain-containing protein n=1 Tax=Littorina saxatilis TaxID=31220 RepID=A0AAN9B7W7_9CAEN